MSELQKRIIVGIIGIPIALTIVYLGGILFGLALSLVSSLALWEFYKLSEKKFVKPNYLLGLMATVIMNIFPSIYIQKGLSSIVPFLFISFIGIISFVIIVVGIEVFRKRDNAIFNISVTFSGVLYIPMMLSFFIGIRELHLLLPQSSSFFDANPILRKITDNWCGIFSILMLISVWITDTAAYFVGKKYGKHKIYPSVSKHKSWEGGIAGFLAGFFAFIILSQIFLDSISLFHSINIGIIIGAIGQIGDFAESKLKRDAAVKDSSTILPGHGGFLDRFDSILFIVPIIFVYLILWLYPEFFRYVINF